MKKYLLLFCAFVLALVSVGCSGSQEIVEPNRDNFNTGPVIRKSPANAENGDLK